MPASIRACAAALLLGFTVCSALAVPQTTHFPSADGRTELVGYL